MKDSTTPRTKQFYRPTGHIPQRPKMVREVYSSEQDAAERLKPGQPNPTFKPYRKREFPDNDKVW